MCFKPSQKEALNLTFYIYFTVYELWTLTLLRNGDLPMTYQFV